MSPSDPGGVDVVLVIDPDHDRPQETVARLGAWGYEGDGCLYIVGTDAWVERTLVGNRLTAAVYVYDTLLKQLKLDLTEFPHRSAADSGAVLVLSVTATVDPELYAEAGDGTAVFSAEAGVTDEQVVEAIQNEEEWPMIFAAPPAPEQSPGVTPPLGDA
ncbi:hypothetical protein AB0I28_17135 [Phytomonospora sp. NPDC050363]|uniref:hypothetical protein n=1 Tax=Phytomonospora sp. NPDC050363 TaxID=3155642 RepID=UPI0033C1950C